MESLDRRPNEMTTRMKVGRALVVFGLVMLGIGTVLYLGNETGILPTIPYAGYVTTMLGAFGEAIGWSLFRGEPLVGAIEQKRTSLVIVLPAMVLFGILLLGAALMVGGNFEETTSAGRWLGTMLFFIISLLIFSSLLRDIVLRFGTRSATR